MKKKPSFSLVQTKQTRVGFSTGALASLAKKILRDHATVDKRLRKQGRMSLELIWIDDAEIRRMNKHYRGKNKPTDVLSFSYLGQPHTADEDTLLGQILISVPTLRKQAKDQMHALSTEAKVLFVHGLLHILGYDHETKRDLKEMKEKEEKYLGDKSGLISRSTAE